MLKITQLSNVSEVQAKMLDEALAYAARGYSVFPCRPKGKEPLTKRGHNNASTDENTIRQWWQQWPDANIGLALKPSNLLVIDLDRHPEKQDGVETYKQIQCINTTFPMPPQSITGGNGIQLFFKRPEASLKSKLDGIDIKTDGYVIVPPSIHPSGNAYAWEEGRSLLEIEPVSCPDWLLFEIMKVSSTIKDSSTTAKIEQAFLHKYPASSGEAIIQRCAFIKHCVADSAVLSEPDWYHGTVGVLSFTVEASEIVHKYSYEHSGYHASITDEKIRHWKRDSQGPATCESIQNKCGDDYCKSCPYNGHIKSPIILGYAKSYSEQSSPVKPFPVDALPTVFKDFAVHAAMAIQCPVDYIACSLLATVSVLMGGKRRIQLDHEWVQQGNLWIAIVGTPSAKKSPAMEKTGVCLRQIEQQLYSQYENELKFYESDLRKYEVDLKQWQKEQSGNPPLKPQKPVLKRLSTSDSTVEALGELLAANPHGLALICDELSSWMRSMNQYKGGRGADRSHYLSMWSNAQITIDRKNKEPILVNSPYLTILGGIQPDVLLELSNNGVEDGMKERFLFSCPKPNTEPPKTGVKIPDEVQKALKEALEKIYQTRTVQEVTIALSVEAQDEFLKARQEWHQKQQSDGFPSEMEAYYVKMVSYLGRLALVLHEMQRPINSQDCNVIDKTTMQHAKALTDYFLYHAAIALGMVRQSHEEQRVEKALKWIKKKGLSVVSPRLLVTSKVAGVKKATEARHLLRAIHDYEYGYWNEATDRLILSQDSVSNAAD